MSEPKEICRKHSAENRSEMAHPRFPYYLCMCTYLNIISWAQSWRAWTVPRAVSNISFNVLVPSLPFPHYLGQRDTQGMWPLVRVLTIEFQYLVCSRVRSVLGYYFSELLAQKIFIYDFCWTPFRGASIDVVLDFPNRRQHSRMKCYTWVGDLME